MNRIANAIAGRLFNEFGYLTMGFDGPAAIGEIVGWEDGATNTRLRVIGVSTIDEFEAQGDRAQSYSDLIETRNAAGYSIHRTAAVHLSRGSLRLTTDD